MSPPYIHCTPFFSLPCARDRREAYNTEFVIVSVVLRLRALLKHKHFMTAVLCRSNPTSMTANHFASDAQEAKARAIEYMELHVSINRLSTELTALENMYKQEHDAYMAAIHCMQGQIAEEECENVMALIETMAILL
jgi:Mg2+ and Co2+ transporter CorA